jgi:RNA polymerase sigma factor (sigma-70 family)
MATNPTSDILQLLRNVALLGEDARRSDGQLLEDYLRHQDTAALAAVVQRHGPMVWGVCRRVLVNHHDAEDAFQATFLVLVRKAASIAARELLANWLYGVAHQTALKARATAAKRKGREKQVPVMPDPATVLPERWHDLQPILDQALGRLSAKYRAVIVLCDLEGKTRKEAAHQLGVPEGTVAGRLARARALLAKRLARHGLALSSGALAALLAQNAAASVPLPVLSATVLATHLFGAGQAEAGMISPPVLALVEGVLKAMLLTKLKIIAAIVLLAALLGYGAVVQLQGAHPPAAQKDPADAVVPERAEQKKGPQPARADETPWGEAAGGWRIRLTAAVPEYQRGKPLPMILEVQNESKAPLPLKQLAWTADATMTRGSGKSLIVRPLIDLSPWAGGGDDLPPGGIQRWTIHFDRMRFAKSPQAGDQVSVRFRLGVRQEPQDKGGTVRHLELYSNVLNLAIKDDHPRVLNKPADLPAKWMEAMDLVYQENTPLLGYRALHIDGDGRACLVAIGTVVRGNPATGPSRTEVVLSRAHLERLVKFLHENKIWELAAVQAPLTGIDAKEYRLCLAAEGASLVGVYPAEFVEQEPLLRALRAEMEQVMAVVAEEAKKAPR